MPVVPKMSSTLKISSNMCACILHLADTVDSGIFYIMFSDFSAVQPGLYVFSINIGERKQ